MTTLLWLVACTRSGGGTQVEPSFLEVTLGNVDVGTAEAPLPFSSTLAAVPVSVQALDRNGAPVDFEGDLTVRVRPGRLGEDPWIHVTGGAWSGTVSIRDGFGPTRIWFTDEGDKDQGTGRTPGWAAGVTPAFHYRFPTLSEMQETTDPETNQLVGEFARVRVDDRRVIVTARQAAGFWVTDLDSPAGTGNNLYVYTFQRPPSEAVVGARLTLLGGIDQEYLASTQISHPTLSFAAEAPVTPPEAVELDACDDPLAVEGLEAARVRLTDATVPDDFGPGSEAYADYLAYGQWPLVLGSCTWYVESTGAAPDFHAVELAGQRLPRVEGMLKQIFDKWVLVLVDAGDLTLPAARPAAPRSAR